MSRILARRRGREGPRDGQTLVLVVLVLMVLSVLIPALVYVAKLESYHADKHKKTSLAYVLAVSGVQKAYRALTVSTVTFNNLMIFGTPITGLNNDVEYLDVAGGSYVVSISSGPNPRQATVVSLGRDRRQKEVRKIIAVYTEQILTGSALYTGTGAHIANGTVVEWGAVISKGPINAAGKTYPQFYSSAAIDLDSNGANPPNCDSPDCCQWFSYYQDLPPVPEIDLNFYRSSAQAGGTYFSGDQCWGSGGGCTGYSYSGGGTVFVEGNLNVRSPGTWVIGNLVVTGDLNLQNGNFGKGTAPLLPVPKAAWKNYCHAWSYYITNFDPTGPASFPGLDNSYAPTTLTYTPSTNKMFTQGLLYVGGSMSEGGGGGNSYLVGTAYVQNYSTMTASSAVTLYYNEGITQGIQVKTEPLLLEKWYDQSGEWPTGGLTQSGSHTGGEE